MQWMAMDLHMHTVASACAELEMIPSLIVRQALALGLTAIAITDHNSAENVAAVAARAAREGLSVIGGMELQTREEVDLLALFPTVDVTLDFGVLVEAVLSPGTNRPAFFGHQIIVDENDEFVREDTRFRQGPLSWSLEKAIKQIHRFDGLAIAAHIDRPSKNIIANLGFIPAELDLDGVEISRNTDVGRFVKERSDIQRLGCVSFGDAHRLSEISAHTSFYVSEPSTDEIRLALGGLSGRDLRICPVVQ